MKRYLLFKGRWSNNDAKGWLDFYGDYDSLKGAEMYTDLDNEDHDWFQIVDSQSKQIIAVGRRGKKVEK
jgi:hypothetical protein